jgi:hypothetical protein
MRDALYIPGDRVSRRGRRRSLPTVAEKHIFGIDDALILAAITAAGTAASAAASQKAAKAAEKQAKTAAASVAQSAKTTKAGVNLLNAQADQVRQQTADDHVTALAAASQLAAAQTANPATVAAAAAGAGGPRVKVKPLDVVVVGGAAVALVAAVAIGRRK